MIFEKKFQDISIAVIGLGYVGLPLAVAFGNKLKTIGFDINKDRVESLIGGSDWTNEVDPDKLKDVSSLSYTSEKNDLVDCDVFIVTVPTPVDKNKEPDLDALRSASKLVGSIMKTGSIVIFESTVYPGATEEICLPIIEDESGLKINKDIFAGYSPERINPGDKSRSLESIIKVTSGSNANSASFVDKLYSLIISAGTYCAESIKVAEAAKVIENTQRDLNIALVNELSILFRYLDLDTEAVLKAAETKWNFLSFRPGLVGGHCIGVDPYYLTYKAREVGYSADVILAGRKINDGMPEYVSNRVLLAMQKKGIKTKGAKTLILGATFKENCPDIRNSKALSLVSALRNKDIDTEIFDPIADFKALSSEYKIQTIEGLQSEAYDAIVLCVAHDYFCELGLKKIKSFCKPNSVFFDLKSVFDISESDERL